MGERFPTPAVECHHDIQCHVNQVRQALAGNLEKETTIFHDSFGFNM